MVGILKKLIYKYNLNKNVTFLGILDEKQMCNRLLNSHVFVSSSTIENESNSISEAKIMGVPVVASYVGGVPSRIQHSNDGFLYQHDAPYMLAHYVCEIFQNDEIAVKLSKNASVSAEKTNGIKINGDEMLSIYSKILNR